MPFSLSYGLKPQPMVTTNMDMAVPLTHHKGAIIVKRDRIAEDRRRLKNFIDGGKYQAKDLYMSTMK